MDEVKTPPSYDEAKITELFDRISGGEGFKRACEEIGLRPATILGWITLDEPRGIAKRYALANECRMMLWSDDIVEIADHSSNDVNVDDDGNMRINHEVVARSKLRVDTRKWLMARMGNRFFSELRKNEHSGPGGGPIETTSLTPEERRKRLEDLGLPVDVLED